MTSIVHIFLHHQSSAGYETLGQTGIIHLPSQHILQGYINCVKSSAGFSNETNN